MSNVVPVCTHIKTDGVRCGSPAVSGTLFCYHHSAVKTALGKARTNGRVPEEGFAPIPFLFPEDRASLQINFFLLLQAFNEQRIDSPTYRLMLSVMKSMARNLGKSGSLVEEAGDQTNSDQYSAISDQKDRAQGPGRRDQEEAGQSIGKSGGRAISAGSMAAESCFTKHPQVQRSGNDLFRMGPLDRTAHRLSYTKLD